jgi:hypothetical protein
MNAEDQITVRSVLTCPPALTTVGREHHLDAPRVLEFLALSFAQLHVCFERSLMARGRNIKLVEPLRRIRPGAQPLQNKNKKKE